MTCQFICKSRLTEEEEEDEEDEEEEEEEENAGDAVSPCPTMSRGTDKTVTVVVYA